MSVVNKFKGNGNKFKGNNAKKGAHGRKEVYAEFNPLTDQYARVVSIEGGKHINLMPLDSTDNKPITALIRGIHHKKVWFKKDDLVVITGIGNLVEIVGKVNDSDIKKIRSKFDKIDADKIGDPIFDDGENESNDDKNEFNFDEI